MNKGKPVPRNVFVVAAKFRKAGAHRKSEKAVRRAEKIKLWVGGVAAAHQAFTLTKDEFESLPTHQSTYA